MKQNEPFFSIILPIHNREQYLEQTLESISKQTYQNIQLLAIDDGSIDASLSILNSFKKHFKNVEIFTQANQGVSQARNLGLQYAKGDYICFVDSDDLLHPNYLHDFYEVILQTKAEILKNTSHIKFKTIPPKTQNIYPIKKLSHYLPSPANIKIGATIWSFCIQRSIIQNTSLLFPPNRIMEDESFMMMLFPLAKQIFCFEGSPYFYRQHSHSIVAKTPIAFDRLENFKDIVAWYQKHQVLDTFPIPFYILYDISLKNPQCLEYFQRSKTLLDELQLSENLLKQNHLVHFLSQNEVSAFQEEYAKSRGVFKYYARKLIQYFRSFF